MPKIIENVREQLLAEAKRQIAAQGYVQTTIRSVARGCGVGVGTVYNYFESKEMLIATFVFEDWKKYLEDMQKLPADQPYVLLRGIYDSLKGFAAENQKLFSDAEATKLMAMASADRHRLLRGQIAGFILPLCQGEQVQAPAFAAEFVAEALLCWSMEDADFDTLYPMLEKAIKK